MKMAIFVVGEHNAGKTTTIRDYLVDRLTMLSKHTFSLKDKFKGFIFFGSIEEGKCTIKSRMEKFNNYDIVIIPTRPRWENGSKLDTLIEKVKKNGIDYQEFFITKGLDTEATYYEHQGLAIAKLLNQLFK